MSEEAHPDSARVTAAPRTQVDVHTGVVATPALRPRARRRNWARWVFGALAVAACGLLGMSLFRRTPAVVELATVVHGQVHVTVGGEGRTHVLHRHMVVAPAAGVLSRIGVRAADSVRIGAVLAELTPTASSLLDPRARVQAEERTGSALAALRQSRTAVARASAAHDLAARDLERGRQLEAAGAIPTQQLDQLRLAARVRSEEVAAAEAGVQMAQHDLAAARAALASVTAPGAAGRLIVRSPIDGVVLRVLQEDEGVVAPGTPLVEVGDGSSIEVLVDVLSDDAARLSVGSSAEVQLAGGTKLQAVVQRVEPKAFTKRSSLGVDEQRVTVALRPTGRGGAAVTLGDGYRVDVTIARESSAPTTVVPSGALIRHNDGWAVFAYRDGRAVLVPVTIGLRDGTRAEVRKGLNAGERVVMYPSDVVVNGGRVSPRN